MIGLIIKRLETNKHRIRNAKKDYYSSKIAGQKFNPKKAWKSINNLLGRQNKPTVVNEINLGGKKFTTPKDIAEGFNDYFSSGIIIKFFFHNSEI